MEAQKWRKCCRNCKKMEKSPHSFRVCKACMAVPYCSPECQKTDWKDHKKICQTLSVSRRAMSPDHLRLAEAAKKWEEKNLPLLQAAAYEALLPTQGHLDHDLLDSHGVVWIIEEDRTNPGQFQVVWGEVRSIEWFKKEFEKTKTREEFEVSLTTNAKTLQALNLKAKNEEDKMFKTLHMLTKCNESIFIPRDCGVAQGIFEDYAQKIHEPDWVEWVKIMIKHHANLPKGRKLRFLPPGLALRKNGPSK